MEAVSSYVPYTDDAGLFPPEAESLVQDYDPKRERVLAIADSQHRAT